MENDGSLAYKLGYWTAAPAQLILFGFLLVREGVPFLPKGNAGALALTLVAGVVAAVPLSAISKRRDLVPLSAMVVFILCSAVLRLDAPTTSMVFVGALVTALTRLAVNFPFVYGLVFAMATAGVVQQTFEFDLPSGVKQSLLSGRPWTPHSAGRDALLLPDSSS